MKRRLVSVAGLIPALVLLSPAAALAKNGEGLYGPTSDLVVTNFGMGLVVLFTVLVFALTGIQTFLERRKETREERLKPQPK